MEIIGKIMNPNNPHNKMKKITLSLKQNIQEKNNNITDKITK